MQEPDFQAIRLPYGEGQIDMLIIVPDEASSLDDLHKKMWSDPSLFQQPFQQSTGTIRMPRFKISDEKTLNQTLESLGLEITVAEGKP